MTKLGLIDEYVLAVVPTFLGRGKSFVAGIKPRLGLRLLETKKYPSGTIVHRYAPSDL